MKHFIFILTSILLTLDLSAAEPLDIGSGRQLFLDDFIIERIDGLKRVMHQPVKRGAVIKPDQPWETSLQTRCSPAWDKERKRFKLWLITSTNIPGFAGTSYAESKDGIMGSPYMLAHGLGTPMADAKTTVKPTREAWMSSGHIDLTMYMTGMPNIARRNIHSSRNNIQIGQ